jgi:hypothetical protein
MTVTGKIEVPVATLSTARGRYEQLNKHELFKKTAITKV